MDVRSVRVSRPPNGGWSITVEIQFYIALSALLAMTRRYSWAPLVAVAAMIGLRLFIFESGRDVEYYAYWTIVGKADNFLLGIAGFSYRYLFERKHLLAAIVFLTFCGIWWVFDFCGGFYLMKPKWPWIILPTIEAASYAILIAYYDASFRPARTGISKFLALIGTYSYSIYLLHFFIVFRAAHFIGQRLDISNFYLSSLFSAAVFFIMVPIGWASYRFIEEPALKLRRPYLRNSTPPTTR